ncbi:MAG TPA: hypothetical protein VJ521_12125, partial [Acidobacteriota bacterium]|nr:hypothetical protein [Acidobacteriota bacterium]
MNASATMIGYGNRLLPAGIQEKKYPGSGHIHVDDEQELLMIHDVSSGELIRQLNLSDEFHLCFIPYMGWLPAKDLIYFQVVQNPHTPRSCDEKAGHYTMNQDGSARKKFWPFSTTYPVEILGGLADGRILFRSLYPTPKLVLFNLPTQAREELPLHNLGYFFRVSGTGKYLAYSSTDYGYNSKRQWTATTHLWIKDLVTGTEKKAYAHQQEAGEYVGIIGWL